MTQIIRYKRVKCVQTRDPKTRRQKWSATLGDGKTITCSKLSELMSAIDAEIRARAEQQSLERRQQRALRRVQQRILAPEGGAA